MAEVAVPAGAGADGGIPEGAERAFVIADVRGYSSFTRERGDAEAARLAARFAELARDAVEARNGRVVELRGDEVFALFESPGLAVRAATELAAICADEAAADDGLPLVPGIGIDVGEGVPVEGGFRGAALNTAARLCSQAAGGQVLVTTRLAERAGRLGGIHFRPAGTAELKGVGPVDLIEAVAEERPRPPAVPGPPPPLPLELEPDAPLVGRERDLSWLRGSFRQAQRGYGRMLVLVGPAGMGKTRLAAELASFAHASGAEVAYAGAGGTATAAAQSALQRVTRAETPVLLVLDDLDATAGTIAPLLEVLLPEVEHRPALVLCLARDEGALLALQRQDDCRRLAPLDADGVRGIAALYAGEDVEHVALESIGRASGGVPARVHELMSEWAQREAARRLEAAAAFLAAERRHRNADLEFANNVIGLKLGRLYSAEPGVVDLEPGEAPYKGLASFEEHDAALFFGREQLVGELAARTVAAGLLAVVGASGSGKSSVIAAGLLPSLRAGLLPGSERWQAVSIRPGEHPLATLPALGGDDRLVLVVDQFEELFTICTDESERAAFVAGLVELARQPERAVVVVGVRGDYYGHCGMYPELARLLAANQVLVGPMSADEVRRAIELPARRAGIRVESALTEALVAEIADEPGGLPLLSTALVELWRGRDDDWLRVATSERLGGVRGAVARLAESSYEHLTEEQREAARRLFLRLVATGEEGVLARRRVSLAELDLERDSALSSVVERLTADRLLTAHESSVEVAHEALLREWPRFQEWLADDAQGREQREHLTESAKRWEAAAREPAELYRGARLTATLDWAAGRDRELNQLEREFLGESRTHADREANRQRRQNRRLRGALAVAAVLLAAAIVGGVIALQQRSSAQHEATVALGRQLGAEAVSQPRIDLAMLLARESLDLNRSSQTEGTMLATLLREPAATGTFTVPITDRPQEVKVSPDGHTIAVVTNNNVMRVYDVRTHRQIRTFPLGNFDYAYVPTTGDLFGVDPRPARPYLLLVDPRNGKTLHSYELSKRWQTTFSSPVEPAVVAPDGRYGFLVWAVQNQDGTEGRTYVERWTLAHGGFSRVAPLPMTGSVAARALPDGRLVVAGDGRVVTWDPVTGRTIRSVRSPKFGAEFVNGGISPDGRTFAYGLADGSVHFFDLSTGKTTDGIGAHSAAVQRIVFSPNSRTAVSVGDDGLAIVWNPATGQPLERLTGHNGRVLGADISNDGQTLYTASLDGSILQYDLGPSRRFGSPFSVGKPGPPPPPHIAMPTSPLLVVSPDSRLFAAAAVGNGGSQTRVGIFSAASLRRLHTVSLGSGRIVSAGAWAGSRFVVGADRGLVQIWNVSGKPAPTAALRGLSTKGQLFSIATADEGRVIAAVDGWYGPQPKNGGPSPHNGELAIWRDGRLVGEHVTNLHAFGDSVSLSPDGSLAAAVVDNNAVIVVDTATDRVDRTIRQQDGSITAAFSRDGVLASGSWSGIVDLWSPKTGRKIGHDLLVAPAPVSSIAFAPDGRTFATSGGSSGHTKIWQTATQQQLGTDLPGGDGLWGSVAYTPDGRYLFSVYGDGSAYRWPVTVGSWERHACAVAGRNFTREEWQRFVGGRSYSKVCP